MRKLFLLFSVMIFGLTLTSCLPGGTHSFTEPSIVYITQSEGTIFGISLYSQRPITSPEIITYTPGTFKGITYSWEESFGYSPIGIAQNAAYNVKIQGDVVDIDKTDIIPRPEDYAGGNSFTGFGVNSYNKMGLLIDDMWLFQYSYKGKEGQIPIVEFFQRDFYGTESTKTIEFDVKLSLEGTPKENATEKTIERYISIDMSPLRSKYLQEGSGNEKIDLKFHFNYNDGISDSNKTIDGFTMEKRKVEE